VARVLVFGTVAADIVLRVDVLPAPGDHIQAEPLGWRTGGSAANVACALASAGHVVELIGPVGTDRMARALLRELHRRGVVTDRMVRIRGASPRAVILIDAHGERTIVGIDRASCASEFALRSSPDVSGADCLYVESYVRYPTSLACAAPRALLAVTPPEGGAELWPADIVIGSESQFPRERLASPFASVSLLAGPRLRWVVVTRAERGADAYGPAGAWHVEAREIRQVDATGAGDAFTAGLLHGLMEDGDIQRAMHLGAAWGAATVARLQSIPPAWEDVLGTA
jgi:sugar/nucleoside kinase (ribokinase family)